MRFLESRWGDVRLAVRSLGRDRGFTIAALFTFAVCLGANVALFAVVNAVLLRPLPFPESDRLVAVGNSYPKAGVPDPIGVSALHFLERRADIAAFADAAAFRGEGRTILQSGSPDRVESMSVSPSFFRVLQVQPALGRTFTEEEGFYGKNNVVVLSDAVWRSRFGADPNVVGRSVRLSDSTSTVIGVMPPEFRFLSANAQLRTPLAFNDNDRKPDSRHSNNLTMIARLKPGLSVAEAQAQIDAWNQTSLKTDPLAQRVIDAGFATTVKDLHGNYVAAMRPVLVLLQAGVLFLLLIGVVNLANLLLVRASGRAKELSVRQVLRAGRGRIATQLATETLVLALAGGVLGLGVGWLAFAEPEFVWSRSTAALGRPAARCVCVRDGVCRFARAGGAARVAGDLAQLARQSRVGFVGRVAWRHDLAGDASAASRIDCRAVRARVCIADGSRPARSQLLARAGGESGFPTGARAHRKPFRCRGRIIRRASSAWRSSSDSPKS